MKKFIKFISLLCIAAMLMSTVAFAQSETPENDTQTPGDTYEPGNTENPDDTENPDEPEVSEKTVVSASAYFGDIYKFINKGEKPDLSAGYIDFKFSDDTQERVLLSDTRLAPFPDTDEIGYLTYTFEIYGSTYSIDFVVVDPTLNVAVFKDLKKNFWGYESIRNVLFAGFFTGMSDSEFAPKESMTRAQFCQMIYNIYKDDPSVMSGDIEVSFTDVEDFRWFYEAVTACARAGIVDGVGDGMFNPTAPIKRQEAAVIMMRILMGADALDNVDVEAALAAARDAGIEAKDFDTASNYAKKAVAASLGVILFGDSEGNLTPKNNINRAECATMMSNYFFDGYIAPPVKYLVYLSPENRANPYTGVNANESEQMYLVAAAAEKYLTEMGYDVYIADVNTSIKEDVQPNRSGEAEQLGADVYVAIHSNAVGKTNNGEHAGGAGGATGFYNGNNKGSKELAQFVYDRLAAFTPTEDNGISDDMLTSKPFAEVRLPTMANLLLEVEFHDYAPYAQWITQNTDGIGKCIAQGIDDYFKSL